MAHAEVVADFMGHGGGRSDGLLRVVLHSDGEGSSRSREWGWGDGGTAASLGWQLDPMGGTHRGMEEDSWQKWGLVS